MPGPVPSPWRGLLLTVRYLSLSCPFQSRRRGKIPGKWLTAGPTQKTTLPTSCPPSGLCLNTAFDLISLAYFKQRLSREPMEPADIQKLCKLSSVVNVYVAATSRLSELPGFSSPTFWPTKGIPRTAFQMAEAHPAPLHTPTVRVKRAILTGSKDHSVELGPTRVS